MTTIVSATDPWFFSMTSANKYIRSVFKFKSKIFVSASRFHRKQDAPALSILYTVAQEWKLPKDVRETCIVAADSPIQKLMPYTSFPMRRKLHPLLVLRKKT